MDNNDIKTTCGLRQCASKINYKNATWWILLAMAVLVVPSVALIVTAILKVNGASEVAIFIASCILCVYIGMNMMKTHKFAHIMFEHVTLSEKITQDFISSISAIESEIAKWKQRYEKCELVFMSLSKQPAWDYLDEVTNYLTNVRQTLESDSTIAFSDIMALNTWLQSSKSIVLEGYLNALKSTYEYARAEFSQQGKNIDETYPELAHGKIAAFVRSPAQAIGFIQELLRTIKQEHPLLAQAEALNMPVSKAA